MTSCNMTLQFSRSCGKNIFACLAAGILANTEQMTYTQTSREIVIMRKTLLLQIIAGVVVAFCALIGTIIYLARSRIITVEMAILMLIGLLGIYIGFGIMIFAYRFVQKLE